MGSTETLKKWFIEATAHRDKHDCSAYLYGEYKRLFSLVVEQKPQKILEIGTGMGFTAAVMATANPSVHIDSIEKDDTHVQNAKQFLQANNLETRVDILSGKAEQILPTFVSVYDLIFFDGYQIHHEFLPQYQRLLRSGGLLVLGNTHLNSKTSDQFFTELHDSSNWQILEQFADTIIAKRK